MKHTRNKKLSTALAVLLCMALLLAPVFTLTSCEPEQGPQGEQGIQGIQGEKGDTGAQGEKGDTGAPGEKGDAGNGIVSVEKTGTNGNVDTYTITFTDGTTATFEVTNGVDGAQGPKGEKGEKGDTGAQGVQGVQGPQGEKGDTGATGPQGEKGEQGETGPQGPRGEQGPQGVAGSAGGETGATGPQGPQGEKGEQGETGATGPQGPQGEKGEQGETGATGATGPKGDKGDKGDQGEAGRGIAGVELVDNYLIIHYTDGTQDKVGPVVAPERTNVALNKPVADYSSSIVLWGLHHTQINDGNRETAWASDLNVHYDQLDPTAFEYITIDLENVYDVSRVVLVPRGMWNGTNVFPEQYEIQVSMDGEHFDTVKTVVDELGTTDCTDRVIDFEATPARYVRLYITRLSYSSTADAGYTVEMSEMKVYGVPHTDD